MEIQYAIFLCILIQKIYAELCSEIMGQAHLMNRAEELESVQRQPWKRRRMLYDTGMVRKGDISLCDGGNLRGKHLVQTHPFLVLRETFVQHSKYAASCRRVAGACDAGI